VEQDWNRGLIGDGAVISRQGAWRHRLLVIMRGADNGSVVAEVGGAGGHVERAAQGLLGGAGKQELPLRFADADGEAKDFQFLFAVEVNGFAARAQDEAACQRGGAVANEVL